MTRARSLAAWLSVGALALATTGGVSYGLTIALAHLTDRRHIAL